MCKFFFGVMCVLWCDVYVVVQYVFSCWFVVRMNSSFCSVVCFLLFDFFYMCQAIDVLLLYDLNTVLLLLVLVVCVYWCICYFFFTLFICIIFNVAYLLVLLIITSRWMLSEECAPSSLLLFFYVCGVNFMKSI